MNVHVEDNGAGFLVTVNGLIVSHHDTLGGAWNHIAWMYKVASQKFTVGMKQVPVAEWLSHMVAVGFIEENAGCV